MVDFNLGEGPAVINSNRDLVVQLIEMLFDTVPMDILGDIHYGTRYDRYLYELNFNAAQLRQAVLSDLYTIDLRGFEPQVETSLLKGTERDIMLVKIDLYKNNLSIEKIYKIS